MVSAEPLIDLDRRPPAPVETPAPARSQPWLLVAVVAMVLLTMAGAVPVRPALTSVLSVADPVTSATLGAGSLFVSTPTEVRRYALPAGTRSWTREFDLNVQNLWIDEATGVLLVLAGGGDQRLTALDAGSGRPLWSEDSDDTVVIALGRGGVLTQSWANGPDRLRLADARTGRPIWSREVDPGAFLGPDELYQGGSPTIVAVGSTGQVVVLSYADGSVLADGDLGLSLEPPAERSVPANSVSVSVVGDRLYLSRRIGGRASLAAYSMRPLTRLWRTSGGLTGTVTDCGPVLCVADTRWVSAVDPAGGGLRWEQPAWGIAYRYDRGRLFAYDNQEDAEAALLDAGSGRVLHALGHSRQLGDLILRTQGIRTWVSEPDPATGDLRTAGSMDHVAAFRCEATGGYLVCPTLTGETQVWQVG
jgi:outer membrane protein assembly factor BamB